ncbi:MAG: hypothetical protein IPK82_06175 [Polyangiaceae bacterium]|nr:hypothetical protein [Polyangiaceae bacterium]
MGFVRRTPRSAIELEENLKKLFENKGHIKSVKANESNSHLEVDLDGAANMFGGEAGKDFYLQIKRGKLREARELADKLLNSQYAPSRTDAQVLFDMIDPQGQ